MGYLFDPSQLHEIGKRAIGLPHAEMCSTIVDELARAYPGHIDTRQDWLFNLAGGLTGVMQVLHASLTEYVLCTARRWVPKGFFGPLPHRHLGCAAQRLVSTYTDRDPSQAHTSTVGELVHFATGVTKAVRIAPQSWMLEYARGPIFTSLPVALGDSIFRAVDPSILGKTLLRYSQLTLRSLLRGKL